MKEITSAQAENNSPAKGAIFAKWGESADTGFAAVPNALIWGQSKLGVSANEMLVILNLISHWWSPNALPYPRTNTIAKRTGLTNRTVQRALSSLSKKGLIARVESMEGPKVYDFTGLRTKLESHARLMKEYYRPGLTKVVELSEGEGAGVQTPSA